MLRNYGAASDAQPDPPAEPGPLLPHEGLVYSASRREFYRFGGHSGCEPRPWAWTFNVDAATWAPVTLDHQKRPSEVVAGTFRWQDGKVYEVDASGNHHLRLRSWTPGTDEFHTLLGLPQQWESFTTYWLVANELGDLFYVATRQNHSMIARFKVTTQGELQFAGLWFGQERIETRPIAGIDEVGITVWVQSGHPHEETLTQKIVSFAQVTAKPKGWIPDDGD